MEERPLHVMTLGSGNEAGGGSGFLSASETSCAILRLMTTSRSPGWRAGAGVVKEDVWFVLVSGAVVRALSPSPLDIPVSLTR